MFNLLNISYNYNKIIIIINVRYSIRKLGKSVHTTKTKLPCLIPGCQKFTVLKSTIQIFEYL